MADYNSFKNEWNGRKIDYDHVYAYQCVDLILQYAYEVLGVVGVVRGNAIDYWTKPSEALTAKMDKLASTDAQPGDIVVLRTNGTQPGDFSGDGHIGICDHADGASVWLLEQNALGGGNGDGKNAIGVWRAIPKTRIAGILRLRPVPPPPAPAPVDVPSVPIYKYERLAQPLAVRVKPNCNLWDLNYSDSYKNARSLAVLSSDPNSPTEFTAVGKATKLDFSDHPVYFMSNESFGNADTTGVPAYNQGVNTIDITPAPTPAPASAPVPVDGDKIDVHVVPPNPEAWKGSFKTNDAGDYKAKASVIVHDLEAKEEDMQLIKGQTVKVAGSFTGPDGIKYWRTINSTNGYTDSKGVKHPPSWRGIPIESLEEDDAIYTFKDDLIDDFKEIKGYIGVRQKAIINAAKVHGDINWLTSRLKKKGK